MKQTLSIDEVRELANEIMLDLPEKELEHLQKEFKAVLEKMDLLQKIDTEEVSPMHYPFDIEQSYLREDDEAMVMTQEEALKNAPKTENGYIIINKVVG